MSKEFFLVLVWSSIRKILSFNKYKIVCTIYDNADPKLNEELSNDAAARNNNESTSYGYRHLRTSLLPFVWLILLSVSLHHSPFLRVDILSYIHSR